ncbi:ATP-binding cassette domain-containing protein [Streptomyces sp. NPDC020875]|uniref:ATP-binding cassette domain-containing protein n=1 Tax=Streptomyces sp. NPDC020875 TaxID=3154898 RepID=UPI0033DAD712
MTEVLESVGLADTAATALDDLSLGMAQRAGIAQALLGDPPVLILDEPANGLDPHSIRWLRDTVRRLAAEGKAVLVSSHLLAEMQHMADHVVVLGRVFRMAPSARRAGPAASGACSRKAEGFPRTGRTWEIPTTRRMRVPGVAGQAQF